MPVLWLTGWNARTSDSHLLHPCCNEVRDWDSSPLLCSDVG